MNSRPGPPSYNPPDALTMLARAQWDASLDTLADLAGIKTTRLNPKAIRGWIQASDGSLQVWYLLTSTAATASGVQRPDDFHITLNPKVWFRAIGTGGGSGVDSLTAGTGLLADGTTGDINIKSVNGFRSLTSSNVVISPTAPTYSLKLTIPDAGGAAYDALLAFNPAGSEGLPNLRVSVAGDKIRVNYTFPAVAGIRLLIRATTASPSPDVLPASRFPSQIYTTDGTILSATFDFVFDGTRFIYDSAIIPS